MDKLDKIKIEELEIYAYHGVFQEENEKGQPFFVNATLYTNTRGAGQKDELELSTHYGDVSHFITKQVQDNCFKLIETVAEHTAQKVLLKFPLIQKLKLEIRKPQAPIGLPFSSVSVEIQRGWHKAYVAFGSNMGDSKAHIENGLAAIKDNELIKVNKISDVITTKPYGGVEQEDFLNGAVELETLYTPQELLGFLHEVEAKEQRERVLRWGPRTLDLDIIFYDKLVFEDDNLILPHVDMENRTFVLEPMVQLAPNFRHPILGKTMRQLLEALK